MKQLRLKACMETLSRIAGMPVMILDAQGRTAMSYGGRCDACAYYQRNLSSAAHCEEVRRLAATRAQDLGETYIYSCPIGLCNMIHAIEGNESAAAILMGPFLLEEADTLMILELQKRFPHNLEYVLALYDKIQQLRTLEPAMATAYSQLLNLLLYTEESDAAQNQRKSAQQRRIGESIQAYKGLANGIPLYPVEKERDLLRYVEAGNSMEANRILNDLLGYALFSRGSDLETIKAWSAELCALLSRTARHQTKNIDFHMSTAFMRSLWETNSLDKLAMILQEIVVKFCRSVFPSSANGEQPAVAYVARYLELHYAEAITLSEMAAKVHLNSSYLSTLFKKALGVSFNEYLNNLRINEAKNRLAQSVSSVTQIAYEVGFESQSYFSKVFHRITGTSPSEYQKMLSQSAEEAETF